MAAYSPLEPHLSSQLWSVPFPWPQASPPLWSTAAWAWATRSTAWPWRYGTVRQLIYSVGRYCGAAVPGGQVTTEAGLYGTRELLGVARCTADTDPACLGWRSAQCGTPYRTRRTSHSAPQVRHMTKAVARTAPCAGLIPGCRAATLRSTLNRTNTVPLPNETWCWGSG